MFFVHKVHDTILIPAANLSLPTEQAIYNEIDQRYPNRVLMDVGLVIARYNNNMSKDNGDTTPSLTVSHGVCVPGQAGAHHHCSFRLIVFRPFVEEVCVGRILRSDEKGVFVTLGFFEDIFIPAYWMLKPSSFEESSGLWVWSPSDDDEEEDEEEAETSEATTKQSTTTTAQTNGTTNIKTEPGTTEATEATTPNTLKGATAEPVAENGEDDAAEEDKEFFKMEIGAEIRFKVKSIHFARITNSAKGRQAVLSTTEKPWASKGSSSSTASGGNSQNGQRSPPDKATSPGATGGGVVEPAKGEAAPGMPLPIRPVRKRSSSVGIDDDMDLPPAMSIVASICEDGLGLTRWWEGGGEDGDDLEGEGES